MSSNKQNTDNKTPFVKASTQNRKWTVINAEGMTLGRLACEIAKILRGKRKSTFTPHCDNGDFVIVTNAAKISYTGKNKGEQSKFYTHSGYIGGLKIESLEELLKRRPTEVIRRVVSRMLTKSTTMRANLLKKLKVYAGASHPHAPQKPTELNELPRI